MGTRDDVRISGRTIRTVEQTPRLAYERYWFDSGVRLPWMAEPRWSSLEAVGEFAVDGPRRGPLLLWDEELGDREHAEALSARYFDGNIGAWHPDPPPLEREATGLDPLDDEDFWPYIDLMGGRMWEKTLNSAAAALAERDELFILRWQETCALKQLALADTLDDIDQNGHEAFWILGAVIGKGRAVYEEILADWGAWDRRWMTDHSQSVPHLGGFAMGRKMGRYVHVTSSFTPLHQRLLDAERRRVAAFQASKPRGGRGPAEVEADLGPDPSLEDVAEYIHAHSGELSRDGFTAAIEMNMQPHMRGLGRISMRAGRALIDDGRKIRMRVVYVDVTAELPEQQVDAVATALESFGGSICSAVELDQVLRSGPMDSDALVVKRRFRGTRAEYLDRFMPS